MKKKLIGLSMIMSIFAVSAMAKISINSTSYQEVTKNNKTTLERASKVVPGTAVVYVNTLSNSSEEKADGLVIVNKINKYMEYVGGSASCKTKCEILYSVNKGKSFDIPSKLFIKKGNKKVKASPKDYTTIKWKVNSLKGKSETTVRYKAKLK